MNKIYNNLSIDNLTKTEWFNQFDVFQQKEILEGLKDNLDVSLYAKPDFNINQMGQIRLGLEDNLNVSIYAKPEIPWRGMEKIRERLLEKSTLK